jgi:hypothetical protein
MHPPFLRGEEDEWVTSHGACRDVRSAVEPGTVERERWLIGFFRIWPAYLSMVVPTGVVILLEASILTYILGIL